MEPWKYDLFVRLASSDPNPFEGLSLSRNERRCYERMVAIKFRVFDGQLYQAVGFKIKQTVWLHSLDQLSVQPKSGVDYRVESIRREKWVRVPRTTDVEQLLREAHDERGHQGRDPTLKFLKSHVHWYGMKLYVENYIKTCEICQRTRVDETKPPLQHIIEKWQIDFTQIPGVPGYFLIIIDCFTKFVWFKYLPTKHAVGVSSFILQLIKKEGRKPRKIQSDNGGEFIANILLEICTELGIELVHGRPYHPQSQGQVERVNRTLKGMLYKLLEARFGGKDGVSSDDLDSCFDEVVDLYNNNRHSSTGYAPIELQRPIITTPTKQLSVKEVQDQQNVQLASLFAIAHDNLVKAAEKQDKVHNAKHKTKLRIFNVGDKVLYRWPDELRQKGELLYNSVARITAVHKNGRYKLEWLENEPSNAHKRNTWGSGELKKYKERNNNNETANEGESSLNAETNNGAIDDDEPELGEKDVVDEEPLDNTPIDYSHGNNTNQHVANEAREELTGLYSSLVQTDPDEPVTCEMWLDVIDPVPAQNEPHEEAEEELPTNQSVQQPAVQQTQREDYEVYQPRKRQRIKQKSSGSQSRLWKEIGLQKH